MKKATKILTFTAALTASALHLSACGNKDDFSCVYGPPPDDDNNTEISQEVDPSATTFDPSDNENADVYGPPPEDVDDEDIDDSSDSSSNENTTDEDTASEEKE